MACSPTSPSAFDAFQKQVKSLCLQEFPCGYGSWQASGNIQAKKLQRFEERDKSNIFTITTADYGAQFEKSETLEQLITEEKSLWTSDYSWSDEAEKLRKVAIYSPWLIDEKFILNFFKTLRIVDQNIEEIDSQFLKFYNLEELSLSANNLSSVNSKNLPRKLRVLELCANKISDLVDLSARPPPLLQHLGLSYNKLHSTDDYVTGEVWPNLLSLDLSHNCLTDLMDVVKKLQSLPKLRNLILQGNPLSLIPAYRGYTVDSLRKLMFLDDISISADERHHYKGLSKKREYILDEAKVQLHVSYIKNIQMPEELQNPEDQPEYPIITYKYYIQFMFLEDKSDEAEIFQILHDEDLSDLSPSQAQFTENEVEESEHSPRKKSLDHEKIQSTQPPSDSQNRFEPDDNQDDKRSLNLSDGQVLESSLRIDDPNNSLFENDDQDATMTQKESSVVKPIKTSPINSDLSSWQDEISLNWTKTVVRDDLLTLRDFFKEGITVNLIQEKVQSYPAEQMQDGLLSPATSSQKKGKKGKKEEKPKTGKEEKKKDKKKKDEVEMVDLPAEISVKAQMHLNLIGFLDGEFSIEDTFMQEPSIDDGKSKMDFSERRNSKNKEQKRDKKKPGSAKMKDDKEKQKEKGSDTGAKNKKDDKNKKGAANVISEEDEVPKTLEFHVKLTLHHWKTAMDMIKSEQSEQLAEVY